LESKRIKPWIVPCGQGSKNSQPLMGTVRRAGGGGHKESQDEEKWLSLKMGLYSYFLEKISVFPC
jgi:hypothetical protein